MHERWAQEGAPDASDMSGNWCPKEKQLVSSFRIKAKEGQKVIEVIQEYGIFKGTYLAAIRISKCHPWHSEK